MAKKKLPTTNTENYKARLKRNLLNLFPPYMGTGARAIFLSNDAKEVQIKLPLSWRTRNYVGTIFGGSMYGATDPIYMIQLIQLLGKSYVVWDKSASIRFLRPGNKTLYARFLITDELLEQIKTDVVEKQEIDLTLDVNFTDLSGKVYAQVTKVLYIADKSFYKEKKAKQTKNA
jgi:acyl-coenzyme A thioesterase PaaI-like protein